MTVWSVIVIVIFGRLDLIITVIVISVVWLRVFKLIAIIVFRVIVIGLVEIHLSGLDGGGLPCRCQSWPWIFGDDGFVTKWLTPLIGFGPGF